MFTNMSVSALPPRVLQQVSELAVLVRPVGLFVAQGHDDQPQRGQAAVNGQRFSKAFPLPRAEG